MRFVLFKFLSRSGPPVDGPKNPWPRVLSLPGRFVGDPALLARDNIIGRQFFSGLQFFRKFNAFPGSYANFCNDSLKMCLGFLTKPLCNFREIVENTYPIHTDLSIIITECVIIFSGGCGTCGSKLVITKCPLLTIRFWATFRLGLCSNRLTIVCTTWTLTGTENNKATNQKLKNLYTVKSWHKDYLWE